ncbi:MAG: DUF1801 domain-containing protein [Polyangiaceae bacterium]
MAAKAKPTSVDAYLAKLSPRTRSAVATIRRAVHAGAPGVKETIAYDMPTFVDTEGRVVLHVAAWKSHVALYPATRALLRTFAKEVARYETSGRGTLRIPLDEPVPEKLVIRIATHRLGEVRAASASAAPDRLPNGNATFGRPPKKRATAKKATAKKATAKKATAKKATAKKATAKRATAKRASRRAPT